MNSRKAASVRGAIVALTLVAFAAVALATDRWPSGLVNPPTLYMIKGYLDRAPDGAVVTDEIEVTAPGAATRKFLVTEYRTPGETPLDRYLSRAMPNRYSVVGRDELVHRLIGAPAGAAVEGKFIAYRYGPPTLMIAELEQPAPKS